MKKFIYSGLILTVIFACKKESALNTEIKTKTDSSPTAGKVDESIKNEHITSLKEFTAEKVSQNLKAHANDTLYITNFFATWCGPCVREIPEFKAKMNELKGKPVKFTFISLDDQTDWSETVKNFAEDKGIAQNTVLLNGADLKPEFFSSNFKNWKGETIPFTIMKKGDKAEEIEGSVTREVLDEKIKSLSGL